MARIFLAAGTNLGNRFRCLEAARSGLAAIPATRFLRASRIYETKAVGGPPQGDYLNAVWELESALYPETFLLHMLALEKSLGRVRTAPNAPRTMDLDILFYGTRVLKSPGLQIPHPRLHERGFVLRPLMELCPGFVHPVFGRSVRELYTAYAQNYPQP